MPKYEIGEDHEWADEKEQEQSDDGRPIIDVGRHVVWIDDNRDAHGYEYGLEWMFNVEDGVVVGYYRGHYLEGRTQSDPMTSPAWEDVPTVIKDRLRTELNLEDRADIPTDLPDHYGKELRADGGQPTVRVIRDSPRRGRTPRGFQTCVEVMVEGEPGTDFMWLDEFLDEHCPNVEVADPDAEVEHA